MQKPREIIQGVYLIKSKGSNCYLIANGDLVLIDTGMPGSEEALLGAIDAIGRRPQDLKQILITHAHLDHVGSLAAIQKATGASVLASRIETDYIEGKKLFSSMHREGIGGSIFRMILFVLENVSAKYSPATVDIPWESSGSVDCLGGLEVIATPGHSPGSLSFYQREKRLLFVGDALGGRRPTLQLPSKFGCFSHRDALRSVKSLAELDFEICLLGHGEPITDCADKKIRMLT